MTLRENLLKNEHEIDTMIEIANSKKPEQFADYISKQEFEKNMAAIDGALMEFEASGMKYVLIFYFMWMYVFQLFYQATYAGRTKRVMRYF